MRGFVLIGVMAAVAAGAATAGQTAGALTTLERQRIASHARITEEWLREEIDGLSPAQLAFRPSTDAWSVLEVLDHLVVVAPIYWDDLQKAVRTPATSRTSMQTDADILWYGIDRTNRELAISTERPTRTLTDAKAGLDAIARAHARLVNYLRTTTDDLRAHLVERQGCDAYQWALLIVTHEQRHLLQIREIKASPRFPVK